MKTVTIHLLLLSSFTLFVSSLCLAQKNGQPPVLEYHYGTKADNQLERAVESLDGGILAIGASESMYSWGGQDAMLVKVNQQGELVYKKSFGNRLDDYPKALAENHLGQILVGGISLLPEEKKQQKSPPIASAWLMCKDFQGQHLWEKTLAENLENTSIEDIYVAPYSQNIAVVGIKEGKVWLMLLHSNGEVAREKVFELGTPLMEALSLRLLVIDEFFYIYGTGDWGRQNSRKSPFILKTNEEGEVLSFTDFPDYVIEKTGNIASLSSEKLIMTGTTLNRDSQEDVFFIKIGTDLDKSRMIYEDYRGRDFDEGIDLLLINDEVKIVGSTRAHKTGAHKENLLLLTVADNGPLQGTPWMWGNKMEERGRQLILKKDGSLWLCGMKDVGNMFWTDQDFYFVCLQKGLKKAPLTPEQRKIIRIKNVPSLKQTPLRLTASNQRSIDLQIENQNDIEVSGLVLRANYKNGQPIQGISIVPQLPLKSIPAGKTEKIAIPIWSGTQVASGTTVVEISLYDSRGQLVEKIEVPVAVTEQPYATFEMIDSRFEGQHQNAIRQGELSTFSFTFQNTSGQDAENVVINFSQPNGVTYQSDYNFEIPLLKKGESHTCELKFTPNTSDKELEIKAIVQEQQSQHSFDFKFEMAVDSLENQTLPAPAASSDFPLIATWNGFHPLHTTRKNYKIQVKGIADRELQLEDFWVIHNGERLNFSGLKMDEVQLKSKKSKKIETTLSAVIPLKPNITNQIAVEITNDGQSDKTETLIVTYDALDMGTLHVMSIGIPDETGQLQYTTKDARDFAALFKNQSGKLFGRVKTYLHTHPDSTFAHKLSSQIYNFNRLQRLNNLSEKDAVVLFISSHGFIGDDGDFRIKCNGYDANNQNFTSLSFEKDILDSLNQLDCQKFLFVDACHSGSINKAFQGRKGMESPYTDAVQKIINTQKSIRAVASCGPGQYSYEDAAWQNGAFTRAIADILKDSALCEQLDLPDASGKKDRALSLMEIYDYLKLRVQTTVKQVRKKEQTPYMPKVEMEEDVPFFAY